MAECQYQIVKFVGLTPKQVAALHRAVEQFSESKMEFLAEVPGESIDLFGRHQLVRILSSKMDETHETYTVEVRILISCSAAKPLRELKIQGTFFSPVITIMRILYTEMKIYHSEEHFVSETETEQD